MFATTQRTLDADGFRGTTLALLLVVGLLGAQLALYAVSETARLEMRQAALDMPLGRGKGTRVG